MRTSRLALPGLCLLIMLTLQGCAGFKANKLPAVMPEQLRASDGSSKSTVFVSWRVEVVGDPITDHAKTEAASVGKRGFADALSASGCCLLVDSAADADVVVEGVSYDEHHREVVAPAFLSSLTLYIIPAWDTTRIRIGLKTHKAGQAYAYELEDAVTKVQWLPMLLAFPFANPLTAVEEVEKNTFETLVIRMRSDGLLNR